MRAKNVVIIGGRLAGLRCAYELWSKHQSVNLLVEATHLIQDILEHFLQQYILHKRSYRIEYRWSGIMGFTEAKKPLVKRLFQNVTAVIICNEIGVALSPVIAEQIEL